MRVRCAGESVVRLLGIVALCCCLPRVCKATDTGLNGECTNCSCRHVDVMSTCSFNSNGKYYVPPPDVMTTNERELMLVAAMVNVTVGDSKCAEEIRSFVCNYMYRPCGNSSSEISLCSDCRQVTQGPCGSEWDTVVDLVRRVQDVYTSSSSLGMQLQTLDCEDLGSPNSSECFVTPIPRPPQISDGDDDDSDNNMWYYCGAAGAGVVLIVLVAIGCLVCCCCYRRRKTGTKSMHREGGFSYTNGMKHGSRAPTLLGWPFVHPRHTRFKGKDELFKQVPDTFVDVLSERRSYIIQHSRVHTTVFLADGSFSEIYQGNVADLQPNQCTTYRTVAVKRFKDTVTTDDMIEYLESSLSISSIGHVNVLRIVAVAFDAQGHLSIVYPYSNEHDLLTWLKKTRTAVFSGPKSQSQEFCVKGFINIVLQIARGMRAIAEKGIPYRMLCARSCLISNSTRVQVVVGDVSMTLQKALRQEVPVENFRHWMAPEAIKEKKFTEKSDVWAYGVTCWEVFTLGSVPFRELPEASGDAQPTGSFPRPPLCPPSLFSLMEKCCMEDAQDRPFFPEVVSMLHILLEGRDLDAAVSDINARVRSRDTSLLIGTPVQCEIYPAVQAVNPFIPITSSPPTSKLSLEENPLRDLTTPEGYLKLVAKRTTDEQELYDEPMNRVSSTSLVAEAMAGRGRTGSNYENTNLGPTQGHSVGERQFETTDDQDIYDEPMIRVTSTSGAMADGEYEDLAGGDYVNAGLGPAKRHSIGATTDVEEFYYNMPKSFLEATKASVNKSAQDLHRQTPASGSAGRTGSGRTAGGSSGRAGTWEGSRSGASDQTKQPPLTVKKPLLPPGKRIVHIPPATGLGPRVKSSAGV